MQYFGLIRTDGIHAAERYSMPQEYSASPGAATPPAFGPPDFKTPPEAAHTGKFVRKNENAEWYHPEAENWQKAEHAKNHQSDPHGNTHAPRAGHRKPAPHDRDRMTGSRIAALLTGIGLLPR